MNLLFSLVVVIVLVGVGVFGGTSSLVTWLLGVALPYVAVAVFLGGVIARVVGWARSPVPFCIPTTCGQQRSLSWIRADNLESPHNTWGVVARMALEILLFRSLFRNTRIRVLGKAQVGYDASKWLWLAALAFHYSMLVILIRHLRFFCEPVPIVIVWLQKLDGFFQIGLPVVYITTFAFLGAAGYLLLRRLYVPQLRYISLASDYFPLLLLLAIGATGVLLRHVVKADLEPVKQLAVGLVSLRPRAPGNVHYLFTTHLLLVSALLIYLPFSKLMHMAGVFLSPTRNLATNSRERRHVNPWNPKVEVHTYEEYEDEFRDKMVAAGIPVDKAPAPAEKG